MINLTCKDNSSELTPIAFNFKDRSFLILSALLLIFLAGLFAYTPWYLSTGIVAGLLTIGVFLLKPEWGLYFLILAIPITPFSLNLIIDQNWNIVLFGGKYMDKVPGYLPFALVTFAGLFFVKLTKLRRVIFDEPLLLLYALLILYAALTISWSDNVFHSYFQLGLLCMNFIIFTLIVTLVRDENSHYRIMTMWLISIFIQFVIAIGLYFYETHTHAIFFADNLIFNLNYYGGLFLPTGAPNVAAGLQDFHETAMLSNMAIAVAFGLLVAEKKSAGRRFVFFLLLGIFMFLTMRTESRAGIGSMLAMLFFLIALVPGVKNWRFRLWPVIVIAALSIYICTHISLQLISQDMPKPRMFFIVENILGGGKLIDTGHTKKESGRMYLWKKSFQAYSDQPWRGLSIGNLKYLVKIPHAHSVYFSLLMDFGLVGFAMIAALSVTLLRRFILVVRQPDSYLKTMSLAMTAGFLAICIHALVDFDYTTTSLWVFLGMLIATYSVTLKFRHTEKSFITST